MKSGGGGAFSRGKLEKRSLRMALTFFFTLVTGPRRSLSLKLSDTKVYAPQIRGGTGAFSRGKLEKRTLRMELAFFFTLATGLRRSLSLKLSDTTVYKPQLRARLGTTAHFCEVVVQSMSLKYLLEGETGEEVLEDGLGLGLGQGYNL